MAVAASGTGDCHRHRQGVTQSQQQLPLVVCLALARGCAELVQERITCFSPFPHCLCGVGTGFVPQIILESQPHKASPCWRRDKGAEGDCTMLVLKGPPGTEVPWGGEVVRRWALPLHFMLPWPPPAAKRIRCHSTPKRFSSP